MGERTPVEVAVGVLIERNDAGHEGRFLLTSRPEGKVYAGYWEFPGGKLEQGETAKQALYRELHEEMGISVTDATPWITQRSHYPHADVELRFFKISDWSGVLHGHEGQQLAWQTIV